MVTRKHGGAPLEGRVAAGPLGSPNYGPDYVWVTLDNCGLSFPFHKKTEIISGVIDRLASLDG